MIWHIDEKLFKDWSQSSQMVMEISFASMESLSYQLG